MAAEREAAKTLIWMILGLLLCGVVVFTFAGCSSSSSGSQTSGKANASGKVSAGESAEPKSSASSKQEECPYAGDWNILLAAESYMTSNIEVKRASGTVHVSSDTMKMNYTIGYSSNEYEGSFDQVTDEGHWMYKVNDRQAIGIGKNKDVGAIIGVFYELGQSASDDDGMAFVLEKADSVVRGSDPFVGTWYSDYGVTVDITPAGTLIGEDADGIWYNFFTVQGDALQLTGIPDRFVLDGDELRYEYEDYEIYFYRVG